MVALLRGINVGKAKQVPMTDLKALLEGLGYEDVATLLRSGNATFTTTAKPAAVERAVSAAIEERFGFEVRVVVRTAAEVRKVLEHAPFADVADDGSRNMVMFLGAKPKAGALDDIDPADVEPDLFELHGRELYVWCPNKLTGSKVFPLLTEQRLGVTTTARNWNTVEKLLVMLEA
jgi:uncharacterized protein (DUF1697 family)